LPAFFFFIPKFTDFDSFTEKSSRKTESFQAAFLFFYFSEMILFGNYYAKKHEDSCALICFV